MSFCLELHCGCAQNLDSAKILIECTHWHEKFTALSQIQLFGKIMIRLCLYEIYWNIGFSNCVCQEQVF